MSGPSLHLTSSPQKQTSDRADHAPSRPSDGRSSKASGKLNDHPGKQWMLNVAQTFSRSSKMSCSPESWSSQAWKYVMTTIAACVSSPRDWAVSFGSHRQQDVDISKAPPHLGAPLPLFDPVHPENHDTKKWRWFPLRHSCHLSLLQRVFSAPPGASCTRGVTNKIIHRTCVPVIAVVLSTKVISAGVASATKNSFPKQRHSHS